MIFRTLIENERVWNHALIKMTSNDTGELYLDTLDRDGDLVTITLGVFLDITFQDGNKYHLDQVTYLIK